MGTWHGHSDMQGHGWTRMHTHAQTPRSSADAMDDLQLCAQTWDIDSLPPGSLSSHGGPHATSLATPHPCRLDSTGPSKPLTQPGVCTGLSSSPYPRAPPYSQGHTGWSRTCSVAGLITLLRPSCPSSHPGVSQVSRAPPPPSTLPAPPSPPPGPPVLLEPPQPGPSLPHFQSPTPQSPTPLPNTNPH